MVIKVSDLVRRSMLLTLMVAALIALATVLAPPAGADAPDPADEMFFYRSNDGTFRYYDFKANAQLGSTIQGGDGYSTGWSLITAVDLDGGGQDEMFFYRSSDGLFRYYDIKANGQLGAPIQGGTGYTKGWDSIAAVDLDGDGQDEMFFYESSTGTFRYYDINANGRIGAPIQGGTGYTKGWDVITAVDLDGDGQDEMFFYENSDGTFRYYDINSDGRIGAPIQGGDGYTTGWDIISAVDVDGDAQDEMFFYENSDGTFRYYDLTSNGQLGSTIQGGSGYSTGWSSITAVSLQGDLPIERVSRFTTFFNCCEPRVTNIRTMARALNGYVLLPGETLSIDRVIGPRTSAKGYVPAPFLQEGEGQCCAVGGGVSQFGTTLHNAVFWGGFRVVSHKPHSGWISRYPLGIEATLVYSSIDYRFTNDTVTPLTIRTSTTSTSLTVELWGNQGGWRVTGAHPIGARSSSLSVLDQGDSTAKRVGGRVIGSAPGVVRIVRTLVQGGVAKTQTWFWNYVS